MSFFLRGTGSCDVDNDTNDDCEIGDVSVCHGTPFQYADAVSAEVVLVDDGTGDTATLGCEPIQNDIVDKVALEIGHGAGRLLVPACHYFERCVGIDIHPFKEKVDELYHKAKSLGGSCEGEPGQRIPDMFYGAYVRDPDGNKIAFYVFG